jgi:anti-sigma factor RsiW
MIPESRGWGMSEQHLLPDAVVAFVDGELSAAARDRAASHMARCPGCLAEAGAQRQARAAVRDAAAPHMPAGLLASLRAIPQHTDLPSRPDGIAVGPDGQLVSVQRPERFAAPLGSTPMMGSSAPLGQGSAVVGRGAGWRAAQGAGVVVSGLMLGALALVSPTGATAGSAVDEPRPPSVSGGGTESGGGAGWNLMRAEFVRGGAAATTTAPTTTTTARAQR